MWVGRGTLKYKKKVLGYNKTATAATAATAVIAVIARGGGREGEDVV